MTISQSKNAAGNEIGIVPAGGILVATVATSALGLYHPAFLVGTILALIISCLMIRKSRSISRTLLGISIFICVAVIILALLGTVMIYMA